MSGEGSGLPFVGSVMSLITHGEVRYEGVLSSIDMPNSSIALSNGEWGALGALKMLSMSRRTHLILVPRGRGCWRRCSG